MSYKLSTATNKKFFHAALKSQQESMELEELPMHYSPKAFMKDDNERKPIMLGWEWERRMLKDMGHTDEGRIVLSNIIKGPLGLYVNARYEVNDLELVSVPCTLSQHKKWMDTYLFKKEVGLETVLGKSGAGRGIHIHISSSAFSVASLKRFVIFISDCKNKGFINKIAGRDIYANRWCKPVGFEYDKNAKGIIVDADLNDNSWDSKSVAVNVDTSFDTVELRIFKTTSDKNVMYRNLEFADALTRFAAVHTYEEMNRKDFMEYVVRNKEKYPHLSVFKMPTRKVKQT